MAPDSRNPNKVMIGGWVTRDFKVRFRAAAEAKGLKQTEAMLLALEQWLNAETRPSTEVEGRED